MNKEYVEVKLPTPNLRDYFAVHAECRMIQSDGNWLLDGNTITEIEKLLGRPQPSGIITNMEWWSEAESVIRYIKANAMLKTREIR